MSCMRFSSVRLTNALTWICLTLGISSSVFAAEPVNLTISTGSVSGVYYPAGGAICRLLNKSQKQHQLHCSVTTSEGSIANIQKLRNNEVPLAIVQSDTEQHAFTGLSEFELSGTMPQLRALFSLYTEAFTVVVRQDSNVQQLSDLIGKRIDIGNPGSGERATMELLMQQLNWKLTDFPMVTALHADERPQALCDNQIDAFVFVAGHPNGAIREASTSCDVKLIALPSDQIADVLKTHPEYTSTTIPGGLYRGNDSDITTLGVTATVLTTDKLDDETAYQIVKATMENLNQFERSHPALKGLKPEMMAHTGITVPLHPGAVRYYREHNIKM
jgi:uncharacterized protein